MADKIADLVIRFCEGDLDYVTGELRKYVQKVEVNGIGNGIVVKGATGIVVGIFRDLEPITVLVQIGFALFGEVWPMLPEFREAWKKIDRYWREKVKSEKKKF